MARPSFSLAHIEHMPSDSESRSVSRSSKEVRTRQQNVVNDGDLELSNFPQRNGSETPQVLSSASSWQEMPDTPEVLTRQSSRGLLPHPQKHNSTDDPEEADLGLHTLEPTLSLVRSRPSRTLSNRPDIVPPTNAPRRAQGKPDIFPNLLSEITCVFVCIMGQLLFAIFTGNIRVNTLRLVPVLDIKASETPWLDGAFLLANGLSVIIFGSLSDLYPPRRLVVGAFTWSTAWNIVGCFTLSPDRKILFFIVRAMQGLSVGVLVSSSMSIMGRIYQPGVRKTRVFSAMAAGAPFGFWLGGLQGGGLSHNLPWIFGSNAMLSALFAVAAFLTVPKLGPAKDSSTAAEPSLRNFDYLGAACAAFGCACLLFGITQGASTDWDPYTYGLVIIGLASLVAFSFVENRVKRPLIPNGLWKTPGFLPVIGAFFLGYGSYVGAWQFFAVQFWARQQRASPLTIALYLTPNALAGLVATWLVSVTLHRYPGHWILTISNVAYALGPVFFLPQTSGSSYWALSMPGVFLATFGPDLSFAACSVFITSNVPRSYQGSAGSVLVTVQNLSGAMVASLSDTIGVGVDGGPNGEVGLEGLRAIWWFSFALAMTAAVITAVFVRIPKTEEKEHAT